jgi:hypothetical protein
MTNLLSLFAVGHISRLLIQLWQLQVTEKHWFIDHLNGGPGGEGGDIAWLCRVYSSLPELT